MIVSNPIHFIWFPIIDKFMIVSNRVETLLWIRSNLVTKHEISFKHYFKITRNCVLVNINLDWLIMLNVKENIWKRSVFLNDIIISLIDKVPKNIFNIFILLLVIFQEYGRLI